MTQSEQVSQVADCLNNTKNELKDIINSDTSSAEEIAEAQEKLNKVEKAEQEYAANQTTSSITETASNDYKFQNNIGNLVLNKINGIYSSASGIIIDAEFIQTEKIAGVEICSKIYGFAKLYNTSIVKDLTYTQLINAISNESESGRLLFTYTNENEDWQKDCFKDDQQKLWKNLGYNNISLIQSFVANEDAEHPSYVVQVTKNDRIRIYMSIYENGRYVASQLEKICPEFWAQKEAEQAEEQNSLESTSNNVALMNSSEDHNDVNYASKFKKFLSESADHETEAEVLTKNKTNPSFDPLFSFEL